MSYRNIKIPVGTLLWMSDGIGIVLCQSYNASAIELSIFHSNVGITTVERTDAVVDKWTTFIPTIWFDTYR